MKISNLEIKKQFFSTLNERQKRQFAAILVDDLGRGGQIAIGRALNIEPDTIRKGKSELINKEILVGNRVRKEGGGRKKNS